MELETGELEIQLVPPKQLSEVKDFWKDDWTGLSDAKARRKRQSRLSKRAQRRRKLTEPQCSAVNSSQKSPSPQVSEPYCRQDYLSSNITISNPVSKRAQNFSKTAALAFYESVSTTQLNSTSHTWFPLPADHLLTLIQFNVYRALLTNLSLITSASSRLPNPKIIPTSALSCFTPLPLPHLPRSLPPLLRPTQLQQQISHPSWIDTFPHPSFRDNLILHFGSFNQTQLCLDTLGDLLHDYDGELVEGGERRGVVIWGESWDVRGWELSEGFVRRWGWLLKGCEELIEGTNFWRRVRGEKGLILDAC